MNKYLQTILIAITACIIAIGAGLGYQYAYSQNNQIQSDSLLKEQKQITAVVNEYANLMPQSVPSNLDDQAINKMVSLLSSQASENLASPHSAGLAQFAGIQDIPDQGITISAVNQKDQNTVQVVTTWHYSGMVTNKTFEMIKENNEWKINSIK